MIGKNENVETWKQNLLDAIRDVSDINLQRETWLGKNPNMVSSFDEVISVLYDDFDFERYIEYHRSIKGEDELYRRFVKLDGLINGYNRAEKDEVILYDPQWLLITDKAKEVLPLLELD